MSTFTSSLHFVGTLGLSVGIYLPAWAISTRNRTSHLERQLPAYSRAICWHLPTSRRDIYSYEPFGGNCQPTDELSVGICLPAGEVFTLTSHLEALATLQASYLLASTYLHESYLLLRAIWRQLPAYRRAICWHLLTCRRGIYSYEPFGGNCQPTRELYVSICLSAGEISTLTSHVEAIASLQASYLLASAYLQERYLLLRAIWMQLPAYKGAICKYLSICRRSRFIYS